MATCTELYIDTLGGLDLGGSTDKNLPYFVVENLATLTVTRVFTLYSRLYNRLCGCMNIAGSTTGWVNYANERSQAALERSSQDAYGVIRLTRSKAAVWTVDDVAHAHLIEIFSKNSYFYPRWHYDPDG